MKFNIVVNDTELKEIKKVIAYSRESEENMETILSALPENIIGRIQRSVYAKDVREETIFKKMASWSKYDYKGFSKLLHDLNL